MDAAHGNYLVITPAHNEERYVRFTLESVASQSLLPACWVIVDDGSHDGTAEIIREYEHQYPWIKYVYNSTEHQPREGGAKVVRAFNFGLERINFGSFDFIVKLDADLTLPIDYFRKIADIFRSEPMLGIVGGKLYDKSPNRNLTSEKVAGYHVRGALKSYRTKCFIDIGGLRPVIGWDGIDEILALLRGWTTKTIDELSVVHHRTTGSAIGQRAACRSTGKALYIRGYDLLLTTARASKEALTRKPYLLSGMYVILGYFAAYLAKESKVLNDGEIRFMRSFLYRRIFFWH